jgi:hypothetical protein
MQNRKNLFAEFCLSFASARGPELKVISQRKMSDLDPDIRKRNESKHCVSDLCTDFLLKGAGMMLIDQLLRSKLSTNLNLPQNEVEHCIKSKSPV